MAVQRDREDRTRDGTIGNLHEDFERLRQRHVRLGRGVRRKQADANQLRRQSLGRVTMAAARNRSGYHPAWLRWSQSYDEVALAADCLARSRPRSLSELLLVFRALEWILLTDAVIVDRGAERQLRAFGRRLRQLAGGRA